jgi:hypothetical protein
MFNLSPALSGSPALSVRRKSGGNVPLLSLDLDPINEPDRAGQPERTHKRRKQKETSETSNKEASLPPSLHVPGDPNLGSHLKNAIEVRAQQVQNRVHNEQTLLKERIDRLHSAKESPVSSSAAYDSISKESPVSSSAADDSISKESPDSSSSVDDSITKEGPDSSSVCGQENPQSLPLKPVSSRKPDVDWAETSPDISDEDVKESVKVCPPATRER